jgi:hypothetical protein
MVTINEELQSSRGPLCLVWKCRNLKLAIKDITSSARLRYRYCPQDEASFLNGIAPAGRGWRTPCRYTGKAVINAAAMAESRQRVIEG